MLSFGRRGSFLSIPNSIDCPASFDEPDPLLAGSAPGLIPGLKAGLSIAWALFLLSNSINPGNGNNFESVYFDMSLTRWGWRGVGVYWAMIKAAAIATRMKNFSHAFYQLTGPYTRPIGANLTWTLRQIG